VVVACQAQLSKNYHCTDCREWWGGVIASPALHHREQAAYPLAFPPPPSPLSPDPGPALAQPHAHLMDVVSSATSLSEKGVGGGHDVMRSRLGCWNLHRRWIGLGL